MDRSLGRGNSGTPPQARLPQLLLEFEAAWQQSTGPTDAPDLAEYLPPTGDPSRSIALLGLVKIDLRERWQHRELVELETYLLRFPELGTTDSVPSELIVEEYRARHLFGDRPSPAAYQRRFPRQYPELVKTLQSGQDPTLPPPPGMASPPAGKPRAVAKGEYFDPRMPYRAIERIGRGSFGEVWKAEAPGGIEVAVKVLLRPSGHEDVRRELNSLEVIKRLRHPFLLGTQAYYPLDDRLAIAMELADCSLNDRLKESRKTNPPGGLPLEQLLRYYREAAEAIDYLHAQGVLHRDIKPANILLVNDHVKVADFGLVRLQEGLRSHEATFCGTPHYMAPEVWDRRTGPASDQYSLAVTYVELRTGQRPFPGRTLDEVEKLHREATPDMPTMYPAERAVLERALAKEPDERYRNCQDFVNALVESVAPHLKRGSAADMLLRDTDAPDRAITETADAASHAPPRARRSSGTQPRAEASRASRGAAAPGESTRPPRTQGESAAIPSSIGVPPSVNPDDAPAPIEEPTSSRGLRVLLILIILSAILVAVRWLLWPRLRVWLGMGGTNPRTLLIEDRLPTAHRSLMSEPPA